MFDGDHPYDWHQKNLGRWRIQMVSRPDIPPPFTALLCCFSMAAETMRIDIDFAGARFQEADNITSINRAN